MLKCLAQKLTLRTSSRVNSIAAGKRQTYFGFGKMIRSNIDNRVYFPPGEDYGNADQTTVLGMMMTMMMKMMMMKTAGR